LKVYANLGEDEKGSLWRLGSADLSFYISFWVWVSCCAKTCAQGYGSISAILRNDVVRQRAVIVGSDAGRHKPCEGCCNFPYSDPGVDVLWYYEILWNVSESSAAHFSPYIFMIVPPCIL
jgi:hypothetical protein